MPSLQGKRSTGNGNYMMVVDVNTPNSCLYPIDNDWHLDDGEANKM